MVYYRKYRPQKIADLDSEELRQKLYSIFSDFSSAPHAFLFTGPKGLGKTSAARIVAKVVNCERRNVILSKAKDLRNKKDSSAKPQNNIQKNVEPCNECSQCTSITNGNNLDILEIDGASNRGIDEIRDLREKVKLAPVSASKKVYIIDEVHMLTTEAFNALLKTLEEPPHHVMFILCTTEPHKVPETILSRCRHIAFRLATKEELLSSFRRIKDSEKLDIEDEVLEYISELSDGSFRDGVKVLDEMVSLSGKDAKITKELIEKTYKVSSIKYQVLSMINFLEKKDTKGSLGLISDLVKQGIDIKFFIEKLVGELHALLLMKVGVDSNLELRVQNSELKVDEIKSLMELFTKANGELKYAVLPQLPLEIAVIEWGMQQQVENPETTQNNRPNYAGVQRLSALGSASFSDKKIEKKENFKNDNDVWSKLINQVKLQNQSIAGILRGCSLKSQDDKDFIIETAYKFHKDKLNEKGAMEILSSAVKEISGNEVKVKVLLKEK